MPGDGDRTSELDECGTDRRERLAVNYKRPMDWKTNEADGPARRLLVPIAEYANRGRLCELKVRSKSNNVRLPSQPRTEVDPASSLMASNA